MEVDVLIIGQGICGTMLSWNFQKEGISYMVIDEEFNSSPSKIAAGMINPVTGRRYSYTWMIDELMPFAVEAYKEIGKYLGIQAIWTKSIIDFFPSPQMRNAFIDRLRENDTYLHSYPDQNQFNPDFNYEFGCGEIRPAYVVYMDLLLHKWRQFITLQNKLIPERFNSDELVLTNKGASYRTIRANKIIFCDGIASCQYPWFRLLPFAPSKGEAMVIECEGLNFQHIFKKGLSLVPLHEANTYWVGSNYLWEFTDDQPSAKFFKEASNLLDSWLKKSYKIIKHSASIRPASLERRPFVGFHPIFTEVGILNGMGTKGTSLAPFFAHQLVQHLIKNLPITPQADVRRFSKILSK